MPDKKQDHWLRRSAEGYVGLNGVFYGNKYKSQLESLFTGRSFYYHGTSEAYASSIRQQGILSKYSLREGSVTKGFLDDNAIQSDAYHGLTYITRNPLIAKEYAVQQHGLSLGKRLLDVQNEMRANVAKGITLDKMHGGSVLKLSIPEWKHKLNRVVNPEIAHFKDFDEYFGSHIDQFLAKGLEPMPEEMLKPIWNSLLSSDVIKGDIGSKLIKGSIDYERVGLKEVFQYAKHNPKNFAKGAAGFLGIGVAAAIGLHGTFFSGRDDAYNTIEGLKHGGQAQKKRREMTPFGSGWDPLRNLVADNIGKGPSVFQEFIRSKGFSEALTKGKIVKELGQGAFGEAHLMETTVQVGQQSHTLQYVRKTALNLKPQKVIEEAKAMHALSDLNAPNVYGIDKEHRTYMEHFKGVMAHEHMLYGGTIAKNTIDDLETFFNASHKRGIAHLDAIRDASRFHPDLSEQGLFTDEVTPYNVIITPEGRAGVFDWGQSTKAGTKPRHGMLSDAEQNKVHYSMTGYIGKTLPTAADLDRELITGLRKQGGKLSEQYTRKVDSTISNTGESAATAGDLPKNKVPQGAPFPNATFASSSDQGSIRKLGMAKTQKATSAMMFENGRSGGKRSKSAFAASRKG